MPSFPASKIIVLILNLARRGDRGLHGTRRTAHCLATQRKGTVSYEHKVDPHLPANNADQVLVQFVLHVGPWDVVPWTPNHSRMSPVLITSVKIRSDSRGNF